MMPRSIVINFRCRSPQLLGQLIAAWHRATGTPEPGLEHIAFRDIWANRQTPLRRVAGDHTIGQPCTDAPSRPAGLACNWPHAPSRTALGGVSHSASMTH